MMHSEITFTIKGISPTLMHNGQLADPLNEWAVAMKKITAKRKKTEADYAELAYLEWRGSLYLNATLQPCWPGINIEGMIRQAARAQSKGKTVEAGLMVQNDSPLIYDGPRDIDELWNDKNFRNVSSAKVQKNRIMRTRPEFKVWELTFMVQYIPEIINRDDIIEFVKYAGPYIGLSDWRPRFGRYTVGSVN